MSHTKGQRIERELVHLHQDAGIPATGVPLSGAAGAAQPTRVTTSQDPWCGSRAWRQGVVSTLVLNDPKPKRCHASHVEGAGAAPGALCYPALDIVGRRDRPRIGAVCPFVRLVSGVSEHIIGDRPRPDPVWETARLSVPPASHGCPASVWARSK